MGKQVIIIFVKNLFKIIFYNKTTVVQKYKFFAENFIPKYMLTKWLQNFLDT